MPNKDYYVILGIARSESSGGIRSAFRDLARRYHPDRAGPRGTRFFQDIVEAYGVLSDTEKRASYDQGLRHAEGVAEKTQIPVVTKSQNEPEPLIPEPLVPQRISLMRDFEVTRPSLEEVFTRFLQNYTQAGLPRSQNLDALNLMIRIGREQAARGGNITFGVPVFYPCPDCHGTGTVFNYQCYSCNHTGMIETEEQVEINIPPMVRHGTVFQLPLKGLGINNLYLQIRILVGDD